MLNGLVLRFFFVTCVLLGCMHSIVRDANAGPIGTNLTISPLFKTNGTPKPTLKNWLYRLSAANTKQAFKADIIYQGQGKAENSFSIIRGVNEGVLYERLSYLNTALGEIVRVGEYLYQKHGQTVKPLENMVIGSQFSRDMDIGEAAKKYYKIKLNLNDNEKIAKRQSVLLVFTPEDQFRYGHRIWLDKVSAVLLKSETFDLNGTILERVQVTSFELLNSLDEVMAKIFDPYKRLLDEKSKLAKGAVHASPANIDERSQQILEKKRLWEWGWLPEGFSVRYHGQNISMDSGKPVEFSIVSDGMAHISIFMEVSDAGVMQKAFKAKGITSAVSKSLRFPGKVYSATVVGEVPLITLERIASAIRVK